MANYFSSGATSTITVGASFIPKIWLDEMLVAREKNLVAGSFFRRINHKGKKGDTLHIPFLSNLSANSKTADTSVTLQTNTEGEVTISLDQHYEVSQLFEDILMVQQMYNLRQEYTKKAGYALSLQLDYQLLKHFAPTADIQIPAGTYTANTTSYAAPTTYILCGGDGTTAYSNVGAGNSTALSDAGIRQATRILDDNNVPAEDRCMIIPPVAKASLLGIDKFVLANYIGRTKELWNAEFGNIYGMPVKVSTNCPVIRSADGTTLHRGVVIAHKDAICSAIQQDIRVQSQYKQEYLGTLVTSDMIWGTKALRLGSTESASSRISHAVTLMIPA